VNTRNGRGGRGMVGLLTAVFATVPLALAGARLGPGDAPGQVPYKEVQAIFDARCVRCHGETSAAAGLRLFSWESLIAGSDYGEAIIAFDADHSPLVEMSEKLVGGPHPVELGAPAPTAAELAVIRHWIDEGARDSAGRVPFDDADQLLYVADQGAAMVSIIDMATNLVIRTVDLQDLGYSLGAMPHHIVVEPDGSYWYLSLIVESAVLKFDRQNHLVGTLDFERPGLLAIDPGSDMLYVARSMIAANPPQGIGVIDRRTMTGEEVGVFIPRPHALAVAPDGQTVFTASLAVNQIVMLNPWTEELEISDLGEARPHTFIGFAVSPSGHIMAGTTELTSSVFLFDLDRAPDMTPIDTIEVGRAPWHPVFTPDGRWLYVGNNWANSITVIDMATHKVAKVITGNGVAQPHGAAVSPDGRYVYISNRNLAMPAGHTKAGHRYTPRHDFADNADVGTVVVIDTETQTIVRIIEVGDYASGLGTAARRIGADP